jgi:hypothetical protein
MSDYGSDQEQEESLSNVNAAGEGWVEGVGPCAGALAADGAVLAADGRVMVHRRWRVALAGGGRLIPQPLSPLRMLASPTPTHQRFGGLGKLNLEEGAEFCCGFCAC